MKSLKKILLPIACNLLLKPKTDKNEYKNIKIAETVVAAVKPRWLICLKRNKTRVRTTRTPR